MSALSLTLKTYRSPGAKVQLRGFVIPGQRKLLDLKTPPDEGVVAFLHEAPSVLI